MKKITFKQLWLVVMGLTMFVQAQALVTVGQTNDCDYDNLLAAYLDADAFVAVTNEITYNDSFIISKPKVITGGFDSCADAAGGVIGSDKTRWSRDDLGTVVSINANQGAPSIVLLSNFEIFGGDNVGSNESGGVSIAGNSNVFISNSDLYNNQGENGGAIKVSGSEVNLTLNNVVVRDNSATEDGGGIYCELGSKVSIFGESSVNNNQASANGGGIAAGSDCHIVSESGDDMAPAQTQYGIRFNRAEFGGGIYLDSGATMQLTGNNQHPASVVFNIAQVGAVTGGEGGGIYLIDENTQLTAVNARIDANFALSYGGGVAVSEGAELTIRRLNSPCWDNNRCSSLANNFLTGEDGSGGAVDIYSFGSVSIAQTSMVGNKANDVAAINVEAGSNLFLEGNLITGNSDWNDDSETVLFQADGGEDGSQIDFFYNTLVDNAALAVFNLDSSAQHALNIHNSIIKNYGLTLQENGTSNNSVRTDCVILTESDSLSGYIGSVLLGLPGFVSAEQGNYQLNSESAAVDMCDEHTFVGGSYNDLNGQVRGFDVVNNANFLGPYDAGAYEFNNDLIFKNNFE